MQVVNGVKYKLTLLVGVSQCRKDGKVSTLEECPVQLSTVCFMGPDDMSLLERCNMYRLHLVSSFWGPCWIWLEPEDMFSYNTDISLRDGHITVINLLTHFMLKMHFIQMWPTEPNPYIVYNHALDQHICIYRKRCGRRWCGSTLLYLPSMTYWNWIGLERAIISERQ